MLMMRELLYPIIDEQHLCATYDLEFKIKIVLCLLSLEHNYCRGCGHRKLLCTMEQCVV